MQLFSLGYLLPLFTFCWTFSFPKTATCATFGLSPEQLPHPVFHYSGCGRNEPSYVCDPTGLISTKYFEEIDAVLDHFHKDFVGPDPCPTRAPEVKGYEVAVAIIPKMEKHWSVDRDEAGAEFARKLFDYWGIGDPVCNNGILIFLSIEDRYGFIATGDGARKRLPDWKASNIIKDVIGPSMYYKQYGTGILKGLAEIKRSLKMQEGPSDPSGWAPTLIFLSFFSVFGIIIYRDYLKDKEFKLMKRRVRTLENDRDLCKKNEYNIESCPICLEDLDFSSKEIPAPVQVNMVRHQHHTAWSKFQEKALEFLSYVKGKFTTAKNTLVHLVRSNAPSVANFIFGKKIEDVYLAQGGRDKYSKHAFAIKCGHIFCEKCIKTWLEKHKTCPICKKELTTLGFEQDSTTPRSLGHGMGNAVVELNAFNRRGLMRLDNRHQRDYFVTRFGREMMWQDMRFRVGRLHRYHPTYVNTSMVNNFRADTRNAYLTRHEHFVRRQQQHISNKGSSSARSSGRRFGGGFSSGGGGGGW